MDSHIIAPPPATFKEKFEAKLAEYEQQNQGSQRKPWSTERILEVINNVRKARVSMISKQDRTSMDYYWLSKYDTMVIGNEDFLIFKKKSPDDPTVLIIPKNEYFGTLEDIHKACGHGGRDKMLHAIKSRFYIPRKAIEIFLALCPTCETKKVLPKKDKVTKPNVSQDFNIRGQVDLMDLQYCPDGEYNWVLNYQDNATKFVSLRPLKTKRAQEIAMELLKIFMIFGAPHILQSDNGCKFTANIIEELTSMWPECKIVYESPRRPQIQDSVHKNKQDVENMLRTWMNDNNSTNWSIGCHHVQFKKNTSFHHIIGRSPYKALFGCDPKAVLNDSVIPVSTLSNVETEEQLQNLSQQEFSSKNNLVDLDIKPVNLEIDIIEHINIDQIKSEPNYELEPCCSINFRDESMTNKNNLQVQEQRDDYKDHTETQESEEHEGYGSQVLYFSCKSEQDEDIQSQLNEPLKGTKRAAEKMVNNTAKKLPPLSIGEPVIISVAKVDSGPLDTQYIKGKIVDLQNGVYRVGTKSGIIKNWFERHEMQFSSEDYNDDIPDIPISLREAISRESLYEPQCFQKCICKPAQKQCRTRRCACFKKNLPCSSKCHNSLSCVNK